MPRKIVQDGLGVILHKGENKWEKVEQIDALDLITEPLGTVYPDQWSLFYVLESVDVNLLKEKLRNPGANWNPEAIRWALEQAHEGKSLITSTIGNASCAGERRRSKILSCSSQGNSEIALLRELNAFFL